MVLEKQKEDEVIMSEDLSDVVQEPEVEEKNKGGRPTEYDEKFCDEIVDYFEKCQAEILIEIQFFQPNKNNLVKDILNPLVKEPDQPLASLSAGAVKTINQKLVATRFPTFVRYARKIGVNQDTLHEWKKKHSKFSESMKMCKDIQEVLLIENGLAELFHPGMVQFLLKNNHGYEDKIKNINANVDIEITEEEKNKLMDRMKVEK